MRRSHSIVVGANFRPSSNNASMQCAFLALNPHKWVGIMANINSLQIANPLNCLRMHPRAGTAKTCP